MGDIRTFYVILSYQCQIRRRMYNQCVIPTMTYGAETWTTTKQLEQKLQVAQRAMERRMLNITIRDKVRNSEIRKQTQVKDIIMKIKEAKWRWAGHLMRRDDNRWTKRMSGNLDVEREAEADRNSGGGMTSHLTQALHWTRLAQDRKQWKNHEEGYIQQWMNTAW